MKHRQFYANSSLGYGLAIPWSSLSAAELYSAGRALDAKPKPSPKPPKRPKGGKY